MVNEQKLLLVTGATGKVGQALIKRLLTSEQYSEFKIRAFCHHREPEPNERIEVFFGSIQNQVDVDRAMDGVTHVVHLATVKETPDLIMDVSVKGLFWLLEACRQSDTSQQFILLGGDAAIGHFYYPHPVPVTEGQKHSAYPGCYALSKVLEETMLEQYYIQYGLNGCCLRAPWIMDKDDFKYSLSFGEDVFGGPRWRDLVGHKIADEYLRTNTIPIMLDPNGVPVKRNFVHVEDVVSAILTALDHAGAHQETFNICMDQPVDYAEVARYLRKTHGFPSVEIKTPYHSTWLDNTKAKFILGWQPDYDMERIIDLAWAYERDESDPRIIWYPG
jgi:nucleoside-diphosphate-sugar epimerase